MPWKLLTPACAAFAIAACGQPAATQIESDAQASESEPGFVAPSGIYKPDPTHRYITFSYLHKGFSRPTVIWRAWDAELKYNAEDPEASFVSVTIDASSVDSGVEVFDGHLNGPNFFDTENYGEITFKSTALNRVDAVSGMMTGDLTIKDVTKPVTLDILMRKSAYDQRNDVYIIGFSGAASINRSEFGLDYLVPVVSDQVDIAIEVEFAMPGNKGG